MMSTFIFFFISAARLTIVMNDNPRNFSSKYPIINKYFTYQEPLHKNDTYPSFLGYIKRNLLIVLGPSWSLARLAWFWLELLGKKFWLGSAPHAFQKDRLSSPYLAKKLGSARLTLSSRTPSYLEKMSWFPMFLPIF